MSVIRLEPRGLLLVYALAVLGLTLVHDTLPLAAGFALALVLSGRNRWRLLRRALLAIVAFNLTVSLGYALMATLGGTFSADYLLVVNLRALLLVYLGFWFVSRVNLLEAVAFCSTLRLLLTLAAGQVQVFRRLLADFRLGFVSRNAARPAYLDRMRAAAAQSQTLLEKSLVMAQDSAQAMRSRGAFLDAGTPAAAPVQPVAPQWRPVRQRPARLWTRPR